MRITSRGGRRGGTCASATSAGGSTTCWRASHSRSAPPRVRRFAKWGQAITRRWWRRSIGRGAQRAPLPKSLFENDDDDAAILRAALPGLVRRHRQRVAVGDRRHPVERERGAAGEVAADFVGAALPEVVVQLLAAGVVRVALDLDVVLLVERLDLAGEIVERALGLL